MRYTIIADDGLVGVEGVFRKVDLADLDSAIHAVQFDTVTGAGHIEYRRSATVEVDARDFDAERAAEQAAGNDCQKQAALRPVLKKARGRRGNADLRDFTPYQVYVERWTAAAASEAPQA